MVDRLQLHYSGCVDNNLLRADTATKASRSCLSNEWGISSTALCGMWKVNVGGPIASSAHQNLLLMAISGRRQLCNDNWSSSYRL